MQSKWNRKQIGTTRHPKPSANTHHPGTKLGGDAGGARQEGEGGHDGCHQRVGQASKLGDKSLRFHGGLSVGHRQQDMHLPTCLYNTERSPELMENVSC